MDEQTATRLAAQQLVDQLGKPAGFMIALRLMQVLAERTSPVTPELVDAFAACLKSMERFAEVAGLEREASAPSAEEDGASRSSSSSTSAFNGSNHGSNGAASAGALGDDDDDVSGGSGRLA